jgi:OOP family OmpA-OmpF porin
MKNKMFLLILALSFSILAIARDVDQKWCPPKEEKVVVVEEKVVEEKPVVEKINLSADALFKFDKSTIDEMLPEGKATLDNLIKQITEGYVSVDNIVLVGHTDRLGSETYNYDLGLKRAQTVKSYLEQNGVTAPISASSAGETQPITTGCIGTKSTTELKACLQPDRRVTVEITGIKKKK